MWRTVFVVALLVCAGCATQAPSIETNESVTQQALSADDGDGRENPWGKERLTVAINNTANESRNFRPLVRDALDFWETNDTRYLGFGVTYELEPDAEDPDLVIGIVEDIDSCANVSDPAGCAPYVTGDGSVSPPVTVRIAGAYSNDSTRLILKHELGHTLGLNHSAEPASVMAPRSSLTTLPQPNATERRLPWRDANFTVYLDGVADGQVRDQIDRALEYYARGANGTVPENVTYTVVENRSDADVVIESADDLACREGDVGSCGRVRGTDPDGDGALERYERLHIAIGDVDADAVGWHVGYWLGYGFGFEDESDWPEPFRDASYDDRRSEWWEDD